MKYLLPILDSTDTFTVNKIICIGRNYAEHAREMGHDPEREPPFFFLKPADAIVVGHDDVIPYPPSTRDLHHEVELVVAIGVDAPEGVLPVEQALSLVYGYAVGLDLTRRDLQARAKAKGLPWDTAKGFDHSAPASDLVPAADAGDLDRRLLSLDVNGERRQQATLASMVFSVAEVINELSKLYALKAGDLVFMGTPAGVAALVPGDHFRASVDGLLALEGDIA